MTRSEILSGGFADPVMQSQSVFRMLMDGMARPGTIQSVGTDAGQPEPLGAAAGAIALTLCDHETPVWLSAALSASPVGDWLGFHTGAPLTKEKAEARFALLEKGAMPSSTRLFSLGTQEYPDRSTTLLLEVAALADDAGRGRRFSLSGPGILQSRNVWIEGLPESFDRLWVDNRALFPRGIDLVLTAGAQFLCLPRTTRFAAGQNTGE
jgi:alpha-D-ribose 1-methylphosphonate 5-triphosphate synthase subunit PhnH